MSGNERVDVLIIGSGASGGMAAAFDLDVDRRFDAEVFFAVSGPTAGG